MLATTLIVKGGRKLWNTGTLSLLSSWVWKGYIPADYAFHSPIFRDKTTLSELTEWRICQRKALNHIWGKLASSNSNSLLNCIFRRGWLRSAMGAVDDQGSNHYLCFVYVNIRWEEISPWINPSLISVCHRTTILPDKECATQFHRHQHSLPAMTRATRSNLRTVQRCVHTVPNGDVIDGRTTCTLSKDIVFKGVLSSVFGEEAVRRHMHNNKSKGTWGEPFLAGECVKWEGQVRVAFMSVAVVSCFWFGADGSICKIVVSTK